MLDDIIAELNRKAHAIELYYGISWGEVIKMTPDTIEKLYDKIDAGSG